MFLVARYPLDVDKARIYTFAMFCCFTSPELSHQITYDTRLIEQFMFILTNTATTRQRAGISSQQVGLPKCERVQIHLQGVSSFPSPSSRTRVCCSSTSFVHTGPFIQGHEARPILRCSRCAPLPRPVAMSHLSAYRPRAGRRPGCPGVRCRPRGECREMSYIVSLGGPSVADFAIRIAQSHGGESA